MKRYAAVAAQRRNSRALKTYCAKQNANFLKTVKSILATENAASSVHLVLTYVESNYLVETQNTNAMRCVMTAGKLLITKEYFIY